MQVLKRQSIQVWRRISSTQGRILRQLVQTSPCSLPLAPYLGFPEDQGHTFPFGFLWGVVSQQPLANQLLLPPRFAQCWGRRSQLSVGGALRTQNSSPTLGPPILSPTAKSPILPCSLTRPHLPPAPAGGAVAPPPHSPPAADGPAVCSTW